MPPGSRWASLSFVTRLSTLCLALNLAFAASASPRSSQPSPFARALRPLPKQSPAMSLVAAPSLVYDSRGGLASRSHKPRVAERKRPVPYAAARRRDVGSLGWESGAEFGPHFRSPTIRPPIQCFSCASIDYEAMWRLREDAPNGVKPLSHYLNRPSTFSEHCANEGLLILRERPALNLVWCNSSCVTITEPASIAGVSYDNYIRGCAGQLFKLEQTKRLLSANSLLHLPRPSAHRCGFEIKLSDLFGGSPHHSVDVCSCGWEKCNTWPLDPALYGDPTPDQLMYLGRSSQPSLSLTLLLLLCALTLANL